MTITYQEKITRKDNVMCKMPHDLLNNDIKSFIEEKKCIQEEYWFHSKGAYIYIYLDKGDRIAVNFVY